MFRGAEEVLEGNKSLFEVVKRMMQPVSVPCFSFTADGNKTEKKTILVMPIRVTELETGELKVVWACSRRQLCKDEECGMAAIEG